MNQHLSDVDDLDPKQRDVVASFQQRVAAMIAQIDASGRASDLDKVVGYTRIPKDDVGRLATLFWTVDEEFVKPLKEMVESFKEDANAVDFQPDDERVYQFMYDVYVHHRGQAS